MNAFDLDELFQLRKPEASICLKDSVDLLPSLIRTYSEAMSNKRVEGQIVNQLRAEPRLSGTNVDAKVNDNSVVLTGSVDTVEQHDLAVRIAQANAGDRNVVDRIEIKQQT